MQEKVKLRAGRYRVPAILNFENGRIFIQVKYNKILIAEFKQMEAPRYHGYDDHNPRKIWSIKNSQRNKFQLDFLQGRDPYAHYDKPLLTFESARPLYDHQREQVSHFLTRRYCIFAGEMGVGKTLSMIESMEHIEGLQHHEAWYIGPRSGVKAVGRELNKWDAKIRPIMMTYEGLVKRLKEWSGKAPRVVVYDESSKIKTPTAQRSQGSGFLANAVRDEWGDDGYVLEMSGTPAPKAPTDWWHQCEVACPGFLKEGNIHKFKARLCIIEERQSITGGVYPHIVTWLDDENKCKHCGEYKDTGNHDVFAGESYHSFEKSVDEVSYLYQRMSGLVLVHFKKDCLDLPEKQYRIMDVKPTVGILRAAKLIAANSKRAIEALTLLRELSDGFQYKQISDGKKTCPNCLGSKKEIIKEELENKFEDRVEDCGYCGGIGEVTKYKKITETVTSPKDEVYIDLLDEHDDIGRFIVWGGFTGTIDRLVEMSQKQGWDILRVDGRGFVGLSSTGESLDSDELLDAMDFSHPKCKKLLEKFPKVCFIGHPQAGGMALTLTSSPTELFYSNSFNGEARMQAEDRFHRAGMDNNRGATVIDLIHLPSDRLVLDNLLKKKRLQNLSMGHVDAALKEVIERVT